MPGHGFDDPLTITNGCLTPSGPLGLALAGETLLRLDIWVYQPGRAACIGFLPGPQGQILRVPPLPDPQTGWKWTMIPDPHDNHFGKPFQAGTAQGIGLSVKRVDATQEIIVEWWSTSINLI